MKRILNLLAAVTLLVTATVARAEVKPCTLSITPFIGGYTFDGTEHRKTMPVYGIRAGFDFTKYFGIEGLFDYAVTETTLHLDNDRHTDMYRYGADALFYLMPDQRLVPYAAAGFGGRSTFTRGVTSGVYPNQIDADVTKTYGTFDWGLGLKYFINDAVALRGDARQIVIFDKSQLNYEYGVGVSFLFDVCKKAPAPAVEEEEVIPEEVTPQPAPGRYKYCVTLHLQYDICKPDIRPEYHDEVAKVGNFMKQYPDTTAVIEGHTDNVPLTDRCNYKDNMALSQARAEKVVDYLVEKFGIDRSRLTAKGFGSTRPVADNATEDGKQKNRRIEAIIDCAVIPKEITPAEHLCMSLLVEFDSGKADIRPQYRDEIAKVAEYMKKYPTTTALIEGHTDNVGGYEYNMKLSQKRADNVVKYLVDNFGIDRSRLTAKGYGYTRAIAYNKTAEGRQKNRRINAVIDCVTVK